MITGIAARTLLDSPVFVATVNDLSTQLQDLTFSTTIDEIQKRQDYFLLHRALKGIVEMLKASASIVQIIQDNEDNMDDDESGELNENPLED